jgi:PIN domain nuclease of toxin-antitoxin system
VSRGLPDADLDRIEALKRLDAPHALRVASLPPMHRDPFDRMIVAQALVEGVPVLTAEAALADYDVEVIAS